MTKASATSKRGTRHVTIDLEKHLETSGLTLTELASRMGLTLVNLSILRNNRAKAIRFSTLEALCEELDCQPGDILRYE